MGGEKDIFVLIEEIKRVERERCAKVCEEVLREFRQRLNNAAWMASGCAQAYYEMPESGKAAEACAVRIRKLD